MALLDKPEPGAGVGPLAAGVQTRRSSSQCIRVEIPVAILLLLSYLGLAGFMVYYGARVSELEKDNAVLRATNKAVLDVVEAVRVKEKP